MDHRGREIVYTIRLKELLIAETKDKRRWHRIRAIWKKLRKKLR